MSDPRRGEVWRVNFDLTIGDEIEKMRPAVVIGIDAIQEFQLRIIVPIRRWKPIFKKDPWKIHLKPSTQNGLSKESAADCLQVKSVSLQRFNKRLGVLTKDELENIAAAIALSVGYNP